MQNPVRDPARSPRHGMAMITALTSVLVAATITLGMARAILTEQRELERRELLSQAELYAQAGFDRAAVLLKDDPKLQEIPAWTPGLKGDLGKLEISYSLENGSREDTKFVSVIAEISSQSGTSVRNFFRGEITQPSPPEDENPVPSENNDADSN